MDSVMRRLFGPLLLLLASCSSAFAQQAQGGGVPAPTYVLASTGTVSRQYTIQSLASRLRVSVREARNLLADAAEPDLRESGVVWEPLREMNAKDLLKSGADFAAGVSMPEPLRLRGKALRGDGRLKLSRPNGEKIDVRYRKKSGEYDSAALRKIYYIMRCQYSMKSVIIPVSLVELLDVIEDHFGKKGLILLSGYRSPEFNALIPGAARYSLHMRGWAADIRVAGHKPSEVTSLALALKAGGVGHYPNQGFTHVDTGPVRRWVH